MKFVQFVLIVEVATLDRSVTGMISNGIATGLCPFHGSSPDSSDPPSPDDVKHIVCHDMRPRRGIVPPQSSTSPWKIFIFRDNIEQLHVQPVTLGSTNQSNPMFQGYLLTARKLGKRNRLGEILGHFEYQWDAIGLCCASETPNMLDGSISQRIKKPNQTVLWTAPNDYLGPFVFVATVWQTVNKYWFQIRSQVVTVIPRKSKYNAPERKR